MVSITPISLRTSRPFTNLRTRAGHFPSWFPWWAWWASLPSRSETSRPCSNLRTRAEHSPSWYPWWAWWASLPLTQRLHDHGLTWGPGQNTPRPDTRGEHGEHHSHLAQRLDGSPLTAHFTCERIYFFNLHFYKNYLSRYTKVFLHTWEWKTAVFELRK